MRAPMWAASIVTSRHGGAAIPAGGSSCSGSRPTRPISGGATGLRSIRRMPTKCMPCSVPTNMTPSRAGSISRMIGALPGGRFTKRAAGVTRTAAGSASRSPCSPRAVGAWWWPVRATTVWSVRPTGGRRGSHARGSCPIRRGGVYDASCSTLRLRRWSMRSTSAGCGAPMTEAGLSRSGGCPVMCSFVRPL